MIYLCFLISYVSRLAILRGFIVLRLAALPRLLELGLSRGFRRPTFVLPFRFAAPLSRKG